jgi:23S rRNA pseudouridine1911/1915/1917 synthase
VSGGDGTTLRVPPGQAGLRADAFFCLAFPFLSRTRIRQKIQQGEAMLNGRRFATSARLRVGDEITVAWRGPVTSDRRDDAPPVILFEDEWFLAVDKRAGQASHPSGAVQSGTLIQQVRRYLLPATRSRIAGGDRTAWPTLVGRLDRFTSGVVLVAKTTAALRAMQRLREGGLVERRYVAVVEGALADDAGVIEAPLGPAVRDPAGARSGAAVALRMVVRPDGLPCVTEFRVLERGGSCTLLHAIPRTGRQHQIRAHLASIGHPVVGDLIYRDEALFLRYWRNGCRLDESLPPRHLLHAERMAFDHPFSGGRLAIEAPVPDDFTDTMAALGLRVLPGPAARTP